MKKLFSVLIAFAAIAMISCKKEDPGTVKTTGKLSVNLELFINVNEVNSGLKAAVPLSDFKVTIFRSNGTAAIVYQHASAMPDTIELAPGNYYIEAHSDNNIPAAFDNPYYYGISSTFTISSNQLQSVQTTCSLANTIVSVRYSDYTRSNFTDYSTTVSSSLGSLIFSRNDTSQGYFQPLPLNLLVNLSYLNANGTNSIKTISGSIANPLAGRHYEVFVNTTPENGGARPQILLDNTAIPTEIVELKNSPDTIIPVGNTIAYGGLLITEIMYDPSALSDTQGEWFEIYNNSNRSINLQNLVLDRDGTNRHTITDSIVLLPGEYFVVARTALATNVLRTYVYGSSVSLPNTGAALAIYNPSSGAVPGALIFSVNYGGANFPSLPGASIGLNPALLNASDAISGTSWCTSVSVYNTTDLGTPGIVNDACI
jgi:hypothetical protein